MLKDGDIVLGLNHTYIYIFKSNPIEHFSIKSEPYYFRNIDSTELYSGERYLGNIDLELIKLLLNLEFF